MEKYKKLLFVAGAGIFSAIVLLASTENIEWLIDEIFAIFVSLLFFSPVINALFEGKPPKEWIVVFIIGGLLCGIFIGIYYGFDLHNIVGLGFRIVLFSSISSIGNWVVGKLEDIIPP